MANKTFTNSFKIFIKTFGCSANISDSEVIAGILAQNGCSIVDSIADAGIVIVNVCTVKGNSKAVAEMKYLSSIAKKRPSLRVIIAGCITPELKQHIHELLPSAAILDTHNIHRILEVVQFPAKFSKTESLFSETGCLELDSSKMQLPKIGFPKIRKNKIIAIVPILSGCIGECSYCSVRLIKGKLHSYPKELILSEIRNAINSGCEEIWITSQDNACYGLDFCAEHSDNTPQNKIKNRKTRHRENLATLLTEVCSLEGAFMIRVGMMNPNNAAKILDELIDAFKHKKVFKFLHIPAQSGSNRILGLMNRNYTAEDFVGIVKKFRQEIPGLTLSTDIICGFPTETGSDFEQSIELIRKARPEIVNISKFQARRGTKAFQLKQLPSNTIKDRSRIMTKLCNDIALMQNKKWIGWKGKILIDELGKKGTATVVGRNHAYRPVVIPYPEHLSGDALTSVLGSWISVRISKTTGSYLIGEKI